MHEALVLLERVPSVLVFLFALTIVAECCAAAGVFDAVAETIVQWGGRRIAPTWLLFMLTTALVTCLLSLDTTAVLMTSAAVAVARRVRAPIAMFAVPTLWLANMASLWLPVSNLTNLLARSHLPAQDALGFLRLAWPIALTTTLVPMACAAIVWRHELWPRQDQVTPAHPPHDEAEPDPVNVHPTTTARQNNTNPTARTGVAVITTAMCVALLVVEPWMAASVAAVGNVIVLAVTSRSRLRRIALPWRSLLLTAALFVAVAVLHGSGLLDRVVASVHDAPPWALAISAAGLANATNNLPAYLALEPAAGSDVTRMLALLIGVNVASGLTWWGSVATLLWRERLRREHVTVSWREHLRLTGTTTLVTTAAALAVLALTR